MNHLYLTCSLLLCLQLPAFSQTAVERKIEKLANEWAHANNTKDIQLLQGLYAPHVVYYAKSIDLQNCLGEKKQFFEANPGYTLAITSIDIEFYEDDVAKCSFIKQEGWDGGQAISTPAYLLLKKNGTGYSIISESEEAVDSQRGYLPLLGPKLEKINYSLYIVTGLVISALLTLLFRIEGGRKAVERRQTSAKAA